MWRSKSERGTREGSTSRWKHNLQWLQTLLESSLSEVENRQRQCFNSRMWSRKKSHQVARAAALHTNPFNHSSFHLGFCSRGWRCQWEEAAGAEKPSSLKTPSSKEKGQQVCHSVAGGDPTLPPPEGRWTGLGLFCCESSSRGRSGTGQSLLFSWTCTIYSSVPYVQTSRRPGGHCHTKPGRTHAAQWYGVALRHISSLGGHEGTRQPQRAQSCAQPSGREGNRQRQAAKGQAGDRNKVSTNAGTPVSAADKGSSTSGFKFPSE